MTRVPTSTARPDAGTPTAPPTPPPTAPPTRTPGPSAERPRLGRAFVAVWAGQVVSTVGSTLGGVGAAVWVFARTGSAVWLGALLALSALPAIAAAPLLRLVDRVDRRRVMLWADALAASGTAVALVLAVTGRLEPWHLVAAGIVGGLGSAFQTPAYQAALPDLVPAAALGRANGLVQLGPAAGLVVGPAIATALVASAGIEAVLVVDLATFAVAIVTVAVTPFRSVRPGHGVTAAPARSGWRWLRDDGRPLLVLLVAAALTNWFLSFFNVALLALATHLGGTARAGLVPAIGGIAMVVVSLALGRWGVPARRVRGLAASLALIAVGALVAAARPSFVLLVVGVAVALAAVPLASATTATVFHERVPGDVLGQVFGLRTTFARALDPLGSLVAGLVAVHVAAPIVTGDGAVADGLRVLVGSGAGRDAAVLLLVAAAGLGVIAIVLARGAQRLALDGTAGPSR